MIRRTVARYATAAAAAAATAASASSSSPAGAVTPDTPVAASKPAAAAARTAQTAAAAAAAGGNGGGASTAATGSFTQPSSPAGATPATATATATTATKPAAATASATASASAAAAGKKATAATNATNATAAAAAPPAKQPLSEVIREGLRHMYHGFRLFGMNTRLAWRYSRQLKQGVALTRRERILLEESTKDLLRLVPFSFFIIVPLGELLLPVALKMFPGLIPSTFETESQGRNRAFGESMKTLRARQRVMEFMSATALATFTDEQQDVIRRAVRGDAVTPKDIRLVAPYFARDKPFSVYNIPDNIAVGMARITGQYRWYHSLVPTRLASPFLRRAVIRHYHTVREDDRMLRVEGMDDLTREELVKANQMRGMRWTEKPETLRVQLEWWSSLARDPTVPYNTLFWIKPVRYSLQKSMNNLPVAQRSQLLGIQNLPVPVRASLESLCNTVDTVAKIEEGPTSADSLAEKIESIADSVKKGDADIDVAGLQVAVGAFLTEENVAKMFEKLTEGKLEEEPVLVSDVIEYIGHATHSSSHSVSILFDAFDYDAGSKPITDAALLAIGARCRAAKPSADGEADDAGAAAKKKKDAAAPSSSASSSPKE